MDVLGRDVGRVRGGAAHAVAVLLGFVSGPGGARRAVVAAARVRTGDLEVF